MTKNIILCTDGTGNAEGRRIGTNVGRIFKAVDLSGNHQVAFYDDGVGTEENKYLRALGGAFGLGLKRNIVDLYEFLCRNYEPGDQIYIFGFSRGAYTARAVAGLICACGVIDRDRKGVSSGKVLRWLSEKAYDACRQSRYTTINKVLSRDPVGSFRKECALDMDVPVRFVGVWDTVDAVGLPIDEAATVFDWIFRFRFTNSILSDLVKKGCQAIAIDDQRHTFHPDLWKADETPGPDKRPRIEQVFFAGMHSNVGGGYPKDELSYAPLKWMMAKARQNGLRFIEDIQQDYERNVNPNGKIYDSRAGMNILYRFKPRNIHELAKAAGINRVEVHESVADRICGKVVDYGPANLRSDFIIVDDDGNPSERHVENQTRLGNANAVYDPKGNAYHHEGGKDVSRFQFALTRVADIAWWRRAVHVTVIIAALAMASLPWWPRINDKPVPCDGMLSCLFETVLGVLSRLFEPVLGILLTVSGGMAETWTKALSANPVAFVAFVLIFAACGILHFVLKPAMTEAGLRAWRVVTDDKKTDIPKNVFHKFAYKIRRAKWANNIAIFVRKIAIPGFFLAIFVFGFVWISTGAILSGWNIAGVYQYGCDPNRIVEDSDDHVLGSVTSNPCILDDKELVAGKTYQIEVTDNGDWIDKTIKTTAPEGFQSSDGGAVMHLSGPFRRHPDQNWFQLMAREGYDMEPFPIRKSGCTFTTQSDGKLTLYVNDVYCPLCANPVGLITGSYDPWKFYENNHGKIDVEITEATDQEAGEKYTCRNQ